MILQFLEPSDNWDDGIEEDKVDNVIEETPKEPETKTENKLESEEKPGKWKLHLMFYKGV